MMGKKKTDEDGMLSEYDFKSAVKRKYADRLQDGSNKPSALPPPLT